MNVEALLAALSVKRPVFHSEADFQQSLAWEIHLAHPNAEIRLEYRPTGVDPKMYLDLWVVCNGAITAIELKYKTCRLIKNYNGEDFELQNHSAQDTGRYDFLKDISRLERVVSAHAAVQGVAIFLTNDSTYWRPSSNQESVDAAFRLHEGRSLTGHLAWGQHASVGTMRSREAPIKLISEYTAGWKDYSHLGIESNVAFRFLHVSVTQI